MAYSNYYELPRWNVDLNTDTILKKCTIRIYRCYDFVDWNTIRFKFKFNITANADKEAWESLINDGYHPSLYLYMHIDDGSVETAVDTARNAYVPVASYMNTISFEVTFDDIDVYTAHSSDDPFANLKVSLFESYRDGPDDHEINVSENVYNLAKSFKINRKYPNAHVVGMPGSYGISITSTQTSFDLPKGLYYQIYHSDGNQYRYLSENLTNIYYMQYSYISWTPNPDIYNSKFDYYGVTELGLLLYIKIYNTREDGTTYLLHDTANDTVTGSEYNRLVLPYTPTITSMSVSLNNSISKFSENPEIAVSGYTKFSWSVTATSLYEEKIKSYEFEIIDSTDESVLGTFNGTSGTSNAIKFKRDCDIWFRFKVVDTNDMTISKWLTNNGDKVSYKAYSYNEPSFISWDAYRSTDKGEKDDTGNHITVICDASVTPLDGRNTLTLTYEVQTSSGTTVKEATPLKNDTKTVISSDIQSDYAYKIIFTATDVTGHKIEKSSNVAVSSLTLHLKEGGKGIGIGRACLKDYAVESAWPIYSSSFKMLDKVMQYNGEQLEINPNKLFWNYPYVKRKNSISIWETICELKITSPGTYLAIGHVTVKGPCDGNQKGIEFQISNPNKNSDLYAPAYAIPKTMQTDDDSTVVATLSLIGMLRILAPDTIVIAANERGTYKSMIMCLRVDDANQ